MEERTYRVLAVMYREMSAYRSQMGSLNGRQLVAFGEHLCRSMRVWEQDLSRLVMRRRRVRLLIRVLSWVLRFFGFHGSQAVSVVGFLHGMHVESRESLPFFIQAVRSRSSSESRRSEDERPEGMHLTPTEMRKAV